MTTKQDILEEARIVDLSDKELLDTIGYTWETAKRLDEAMKQDPEIERMQAELKDYKDTRYLDQKRKVLKKLKAARAMAKVRGLNFKLPGKVTDDE